MSYDNLAIAFGINNWNYSKCKDILQTLNVYKIPAKERQVVDHLDADEISVS